MKRFLVLILVGTFAAGLVGCAKDTPTEEPNPIVIEYPEVDTTAPVISGVEDLIKYEGSFFDSLYRVSAVDNFDGNVTGNIIVTGSIDINTVGTYYLTYSVTDKVGNKAEIIRVITVKSEYKVNDDLAPVLAGVEDVTLFLNDTFSSLTGISAIDNIDGDITSDIIITGAVDVTTVGTYHQTYFVIDDAGNSSEFSRDVTVSSELDYNIPIVESINFHDMIDGDINPYDGESFFFRQNDDFVIIISLSNIENVEEILSVQINGGIYKVDEFLQIEFYKSLPYYYPIGTAKITVKDDLSQIYIPVSTDDCTDIVDIVIEKIIYKSNNKAVSFELDSTVENSFTMATVLWEPFFHYIKSIDYWLDYNEETGEIIIPDPYNEDAGEIFGFIINDGETIYQMDENNTIVFLEENNRDYIKVTPIYNNGFKLVETKFSLYTRIIINTYDELIELQRELNKQVYINADIVIPNNGTYEPFIGNIELYSEPGTTYKIINESIEEILFIEEFTNVYLAWDGEYYTDSSVVLISNVSFEGKFIIRGNEVNIVDSEFKDHLVIYVESDDMLNIVNPTGSLSFESHLLYN